MGQLLNFVGLGTGVALYAMLLVMVVRGGRASRPGTDPLLLSTAVLGLVWNLCALPAYELPKLGVSGSFDALTAIGFSALGLLPAVAVHSVLRREPEQLERWLGWSIVAIAYGVSSLAAVLQLDAMWLGQALPSGAAMRLLTYTYVALVLPLAAATRRQPGAGRALWAAALAIFAVSALHLSQFHQGDPSWPVELVGHHASLPLALAILYQDFPFALADLFLKRALTLLILVTAAFLSIAGLGLLPIGASSFANGQVGIGLLVLLWVATALLYPSLLRASAWFVDTVVLHRPDYASLKVRIAHALQQNDDVEGMLDEVCLLLAPALSARWVTWHKMPDAASAQTLTNKVPPPGIVMSTDVPVTDPPGLVIEVGELTRGRRLLSDDRAFLQSVAALVGRRVDAVRITRERYDRAIREQEISKLATEAELRALRAQLNPHFLFNALTTIGYLIQVAPSRALNTLMRLTSLLRAVLRSEGEMSTLGRELDLIEAYLDIERARFEDRLSVRIEVAAALRDLPIPPLLIQPLVENAIKHGIAPGRRGGEIALTAHLEPGLGRDRLIVVVRDSGAGATEAELMAGRREGVGLSNVELRLMRLYGPTAGLTIHSGPGVGTVVEVRLPVTIESAAPARRPA
jgi:two-component system LytT family sensor kinase